MLHSFEKPVISKYAKRSFIARNDVGNAGPVAMVQHPMDISYFNAYWLSTLFFFLKLPLPYHNFVLSMLKVHGF